ncbi:hypothetical protein [Fictibacillus gelatini]|uniref:hypothetical protein n=1 Tax=Fictibacillus gelatini TaxID=225985 RepID=UPI00041B05F6|nr:hypothetical protein [Fictibacillus gelatini]
MQTVVFNRITHKVAGLNRSAFPLEYAMSLPYEITLSKIVEEVHGKNQKTNAQGLPLYKDNVTVDEFGRETYDEVTEAHKAVAFEEIANTYVIDGKEVDVPAQVPTEWVDLEPVMIDNVVNQTVSFQDDPYAFTYEEVLEAKKASIQANNLRQLVYYDEDFNLESFSTNLASFAANMGDGILAIHPGGQVRNEKIPLGTPAKTIQLYLESAPNIKVEVGATVTSFVEFKDGIAQLSTAADQVYVRFTNTSDKFRDVYAFGILI